MLNTELESYLSHLYHERRFKINEISDDLGCSKATVSRLLKKFKIRTGLHKSRIDPTKYGFGNLSHLILTLSECIKLGVNKTTIAKNMNCSRRTVIRLCNKFGIT